MRRGGEVVGGPSEETSGVEEETYRRDVWDECFDPGEYMQFSSSGWKGVEVKRTRFVPSRGLAL